MQGFLVLVFIFYKSRKYKMCNKYFQFIALHFFIALRGGVTQKQYGENSQNSYS